MWNTAKADFILSYDKRPEECPERRSRSAAPAFIYERTWIFFRSYRQKGFLAKALGDVSS
jgi:hypothetical protein